LRDFSTSFEKKIMQKYTNYIIKVQI